MNRFCLTDKLSVSCSCHSELFVFDSLLKWHVATSQCCLMDPLRMPSTGKGEVKYHDDWVSFTERDPSPRSASGLWSLCVSCVCRVCVVCVFQHVCECRAGQSEPQAGGSRQHQSGSKSGGAFHVSENPKHNVTVIVSSSFTVYEANCHATPYRTHEVYNSPEHFLCVIPSCMAVLLCVVFQ